MYPLSKTCVYSGHSLKGLSVGAKILDMALSCTVKPADSFECDHVEIAEPEKRNLRRVCDDISLDVFLVAGVELAERFTYRSITAPMRESNR